MPAPETVISTTPASAVGRLSQRTASRTVLSWPTIAFLERPARSASSLMTSSSRRSSSDARSSAVAAAPCSAVNAVEASIRASRSSPESTDARICSRSRGSRSGPSRSRMTSSTCAASTVVPPTTGIVAGTAPATRRSANASTADAVGLEGRSYQVRCSGEPAMDPRDAALTDAPKHLGDVDVPVEARGVRSQVAEHGIDEGLRAATQGGRGDTQSQRAGGQRPDLRRVRFVDTHAPQELLLELGELGIGQDLGVDALVGIGSHQRGRVEIGVEQPTPNEHNRRDEHVANDEDGYQEKRRPRPRPSAVAAARRTFARHGLHRRRGILLSHHQTARGGVGRRHQPL